MRTLSRPVIALATMALASTGLAVGAGSASAALTTYCDGDAANVTVPGDLVVAEGDSCILDDVTVEGTVQVQSGADLMVDGSTLGDDVTVEADGYFDATSSSVAGDLTSSAGYGVYLDGTTVGGNYSGQAGEDADPFLFSYDSGFSGGIDVAQGLVHLQTADVAGDVSTDGATYTDVIDSTVVGGLSVAGNPEGTAICESEVDGTATFSGNGEVQLGTGLDLIDCSGANYFGSDVLIDSSTGAVDVTDNIIRGDLAGEGNDPAPTGSDNRVRGERGGQFTDLAPAPETLSAQSVPADHAEELTQKRDERRSSAEDAAELAGPAALR